LGAINFNAIAICADHFLGSLASLRLEEQVNRMELMANSISIERTVRKLSNSPWASDHPQNIAKIWPKHDLLLNSIHLSTMELYTYRLTYMMGVSAPYTWVQTIVQEAIDTEPSVNLISTPTSY
jgi:hypothetical protein